MQGMFRAQDFGNRRKGVMNDRRKDAVSLSSRETKRHEGKPSASRDLTGGADNESDKVRSKFVNGAVASC